MPNHILKQDNKALQTLLGRVNQLKEWNRLFAEYLEPEIAKHCEIVNYEKNCFIVIVENGSYATQLRFQIPDLMAKLKQHPQWVKLSGIICKTRPKHTLASNSRSRTKTYLTQKTAKSILDSAQSVKDEKIRTRLQKIAGYTSKK